MGKTVRTKRRREREGIGSRNRGNWYTHTFVFPEIFNQMTYSSVPVVHRGRSSGRLVSVGQLNSIKLLWLARFSAYSDECLLYGQQYRLLLTAYTSTDARLLYQL